MIEFLIFIMFPLFIAALLFAIKDLKLQYMFSLITGGFHLAFSFIVFTNNFSSKMPMFFELDGLNRYFLLILSNVYFWVVLVSYKFIKERINEEAKISYSYYFLLLNVYLASNSAALLSNHFGMYWVSVEATTLSVAPLIYFYKNEEALEAMWKYLFVVSLGIAFAFIGILFLSLSSKDTSIEGGQLFFSSFITHAKELNPIWLKASFIFIFIGLSTKIGIAPMHNGDVDATANAPSPIAALMSGSLRLTALIGVMRIFNIIKFTDSFQFARTLLIIGAVLSIIAAFIYMFKANNYKRMLAYSSVEHLGIITLGLGIGNIAFLGALLHAFYNSICKIILFLSAGKIHRFYGSREINKVNGVLKHFPISGWLFIIAYMAISGIPPFGIFFSELTIFEGILISDLPFVLILLMILLLFIFINMGKITFNMVYKEENDIKLLGKKDSFDIINIVSVLLVILLVVVASSASKFLTPNLIEITKAFGYAL
ncbi:MAG TPA: proton-conducting transporter membrane subunit [Melioribacteraceae bacterium]|nr:proton-conducting transporter membrane subunit [Melioribacteraceae bacterium]